MNLNLTADYWWAWMAPMLWQGTLFMMLVAVVDRLLSQWVWPQVRLTLWLLVLVKLVLPPTTTSPVAIPHVQQLAELPTEVATAASWSPWLFSICATMRS